VVELEAAREEKGKEAEVAKRESRDRKDELDKLRSELLDTKAKLKRQKQKSEDEEKRIRPRDGGEETPSYPDSAASNVVVMNREAEEASLKIREELEAKLATAEAEVAKLQAAETKRKAALAQAERKEASTEKSTISPEEQIEGLEAQLEALRRAQKTSEADADKELRKVRAELRSAEKRAANNHQLYQVAKGQLQVTEDRLANIRKKYEGAKAPEELRSKNGASAEESAPKTVTEETLTPPAVEAITHEDETATERPAEAPTS
jgi:chromosome segregation ATPase